MAEEIELWESANPSELGYVNALGISCVARGALDEVLLSEDPKMQHSNGESTGAWAKPWTREFPERTALERSHHT